jgi:hypothetical protein
VKLTTHLQSVPRSRNRGSLHSLSHIPSWCIYIYPDIKSGCQCPWYITIELTPCSRALLEKPAVTQPLNNFPTFYGTQRFITVHKSPPLVPVQNQMDPVHVTLSVLRSILMLSFYLCLGLPSDVFSCGIPTKILYTFPLSAIHATFPAHLILLDLIILIMFGEEYKIGSCTT